jgi:hypothetical protein
MSIVLTIAVVLFFIFAILGKRHSKDVIVEENSLSNLEKKSELDEVLEECRKMKQKREEENRAFLQSELQKYSSYRKIEFEVKGVFYRSKVAKEMIPILDVHDEIKLSKEPDNPYDPFAVKVLCDRKHLGYVPTELSKEVTSLINRKMIKKILVINAGDAKLYAWDDPDPYLEIAIFVESKAEH